MNRVVIYTLALLYLSTGCGDPFVEGQAELPGGYVLLKTTQGDFVLRGPAHFDPPFTSELSALTNDVQLGLSVRRLGWNERHLFVRSGQIGFVASLEPGATPRQLEWRVVAALADSAGVQLRTATEAWASLDGQDR